MATQMRRYSSTRGNGSGWYYESARHSLAARGISTGRRYQVVGAAVKVSRAGVALLRGGAGLTKGAVGGATRVFKPAAARGLGKVMKGAGVGLQKLGSAAQVRGAEMRVAAALRQIEDVGKYGRTGLTDVPRALVAPGRGSLVEQITRTGFSKGRFGPVVVRQPGILTPLRTLRAEQTVASIRATLSAEDLAKFNALAMKYGDNLGPWARPYAAKVFAQEWDDAYRNIKAMYGVKYADNFKALNPQDVWVARRMNELAPLLAKGQARFQNIGKLTFWKGAGLVGGGAAGGAGLVAMINKARTGEFLPTAPGAPPGGPPQGDVPIIPGGETPGGGTQYWCSDLNGNGVCDPNEPVYDRAAMEEAGYLTTGELEGEPGWLSKAGPLIAGAGIGALALYAMGGGGEDEEERRRREQAELEAQAARMNEELSRRQFLELQAQAAEREGMANAAAIRSMGTSGVRPYYARKKVVVTR